MATNENTVYKRKAKKTGSSIQATIPMEIARHLKIHPGDTVVFKYTQTGDVVIEKEKSIADKMDVGEDFLQALHEGMTEYHDALNDLVER